MKVNYLILFVLSCLINIYGEMSLSQLFSDHMVLQAEKPVSIWGWDNPNQKIQVTFDKQSITAITDESGKWLAIFEPMKVNSTGQTLKVSGSTDIVLKDVLIGEVWCLFGRSNVSFPLQKCVGGMDAIAEANYSNIRVVQLSGQPNINPQKDAQTRGWSTVSPKSAKRMSGVGYWFVEALYQAREVPIGLVRNSWGGSPGSMWIRRDIYERSFPQKGEQKLDWLEEFESESKNYHEHGEGVREYGDGKGDRIGTLYQPRVVPLLNLACRGIIFYCSGTLAAETEIVARTWRHAWGDPQLPFLYVQIPPSGGPEANNLQKVCNLDAGFRSAFMALDLSGRIQNSVMVTANGTQAGVEKRDIHPPIKKPLGERLARAARVLAYGEDILEGGPKYQSHQVNKNTAIITFANAKGLASLDQDLEGFAASEDGRNWKWVEAQVHESTVHITANGFSPKYIAYAVGNQPKGNLVNKDGLPAATFNTAVTYP